MFKEKLVKLAVLGMVFFGLVSSLQAGEKNLVPNPGFEEEAEGKVARGWRMSSAVGAPIFAWDDKVFHSGKRSVSIEGKEAVYGLCGVSIPIAPGEYKFSYWMKNEDVDATKEMRRIGAGSRVNFHFFDEKNKYLESPSFRFIKGTKEWTKYENVAVAPEKTKFLRIHCMLHKATGKVWFDDIQVQRRDIVNAGLAKRVSSPPKIDGQLNDKCWQGLSELTDFVYHKDGEIVKDQTTVSLGYDDENLYLGFRCNESDMTKIKAEIKERDGRVYVDDSIEIFLDTNFNRDSYYQLVANIKEVKFDVMINDWDHSSFTRDLSFNPDWEVKTSQGRDSWVMETAIPFKELHLSGPPPAGTIWGINLCRNDTTPGISSSWTYVGNRFHTPSQFGLLIFGNYKDNLMPKLAFLKEKLSRLKEDLKVKDVTPQKLASQLEEVDTQLKGISSAGEWVFLDSKMKKMERAITGLEHADKEYLVWSKTPSVQLRPDDFPEADELIKELNISSYINEYESANFILTNIGEKTLFMRILVNELTDEKTKRIIPPKNIEVRVASFIKLHVKDWIIADALPRINEANLLTLPPDIPTQVWLTFKTKDISAGSYKGKISIKPLYDAPLRDIGINLRVYPLKLSDKPPLKTYMGPVFMTRHRKNFTEETCRVYAKDIAEHKAAFVLWTTGKNIRWIFDKTGYKGIREDQKASFERRARTFREQGMDILLLEVHDALYCNPAYDYWLAHKHLGILTPAWKEAIREWLPDAVSYLKSVGYDYDHLYICVGHEVRGKGAEQAAQVAKFVKEVDPKIKLWVIGSGCNLEDIKKLAHYVDGFMIYGRTLLPHTEMIKFLKSEGKIVTFNVTGGPMKPRSPFGVFRRMGWDAWFHGVDGMCLWTYDYFDRDSWMAEPLGKKSHGDASVIYIDSNWPKEPVTSRRWEMFREGIEDYCHLHMLKKTIEKAKANGIDTLRGKVLLGRFSEEVYRSRDAEDEIYPYTKEVADETIRLNAEMSFKVTSPEVKIKENDVIIQWETTEPAKGKVYYRKVIEGYGAKSFAQVWLSIEGNSYHNKHSICLTNLDLTNEYIFYTSSSNEIGYVVEDDNAGKYYALGKR